MKLVTYTASCGTLDPVRSDILCLTGYDRCKDPRRNARALKILSHLFVEADVSLWIDATIQLLVPPEQLVEMMGAADVALFRHCERSNIYDEGAFCIERHKDSEAVIAKQLAVYRQRGYAKQDLGMTFILARRHTPQIARLNEQWWAELTRYSVRDQIAFPVVFDQVATYWDSVPLTRSAYFIRHPHGTRIA